MSVNYTKGQYIVQESVHAFFENLLDVPVWVKFMKSKGYQVTVYQKVKAVNIFPEHPYEVSASRSRTRRTITRTSRKTQETSK